MFGPAHCKCGLEGRYRGRIHRERHGEVISLVPRIRQFSLGFDELPIAGVDGILGALDGGESVGGAENDVVDTVDIAEEVVAFYKEATRDCCSPSMFHSLVSGSVKIKVLPSP